jgi:hypothetical protein
MKKVFFFLVYSACLSSLFAQECPTNAVSSACCNGVISTDPRNGGTANLERPNIIHQFNWMGDKFAAYYPPIFVENGANYYNVNPFMICEDAYLRHLNFYDYRPDACGNPKPVEKLDFYPEDGWELLHKQNGLELDEQTRIASGNTNRSWPYYILYNKYRGKIRFVGVSDRQGNDAQNIVVKMGFPEPAGGKPYTNISALLSAETNTPQTLDTWSQHVAMSSASTYPKFPGVFTADFNVGYDPCACGRKPDDLTFNFSSLQTADIQMGGRLIGTNVQLNGSGTSPLLNREDFLLNVNTNGYNVNGGAMTYRNIDALVDKYTIPQRTPFENLMIQGIKSGISAGTNAISGGLFTGIRDFYCNNVYGRLGNVLAQVGLVNSNGEPQGILKDVKISAGTLATGSDYISGLIFGKPQATPNITFIEAELALKGQIRTNTPFGNASIRLAHPGSMVGNLKNPDGSYKYALNNYPFYNEALGIVSFLKQPQAYFTYEKNSVTLHDGLNSPVSTTFSESFGIKLRENLEYYFNPTLDIDFEKTRVFAAYVMDVNKDAVDLRDSEPLAYANKIGPFNRVIDSKDTTIISYITNFFPLDCFQEMSASFSHNTLELFGQNRFLDPRNLKMRVFLDIIYKKNKYNKENRHNLVYTFPLLPQKVELKQVPTGEWSVDNNGFGYEVTRTVIPQELTNILAAPKMDQFNFLEIIKDNIFTENTEIKAWGKIIVAGNIQVAQGKTLKLIAPEIDVVSSIKLLPNIEIIATQVTPIGCNNISYPVSAEHMKQFCNSNEYKSNNAISLRHSNPVDTIINSENFNVVFDISPNPFDNFLTVNYDLNQTEQIEIMMYNTLGQAIKTIVNQTVEAGNYQVHVPTDDLAQGTYLITLRTKSGVQTKKVMK